jgi:hypothetical protein
VLLVVLIVSVEVPVPPADRTTLGGLKDVVGRLLTVALETAAWSVTVPWKPLRLVRVIVEVADAPIPMVRDVGLADMLKSGGGTEMVTTAAWVTVSP